MTEKEQFLTQLEKELPTTMRVLKAYPAAMADLKPHAKCKSARELAWIFVTEQKASEQALDGGIEFGKMPKAPATMNDRGQFSIYLRMADGKVPSIYGPSAAEPWM